MVLDILARLERLFRIDMRYAASGGFFLSLTQVSSAFFGIILTTAFANLLPVATYGTYKYILAVYAVLAIAALPGIDTAVLQSVSRGYDRAFVEGLRLKMKWGLLGTAGAIAFAAYQYAQGSVIIATLFVIAGLALPFFESFSLYYAYFNAKKLYRPWAAADILGQCISITVLIATIFFTKNIIALLVAYFVPYIVARALVTWWLLRRYTMNDAHDEHFRTYGKSLTVFQIITRAISSADQIVLYHFLGPAQVAIYSLATAVPTRLQGLFRISGMLAFPKFATRTGSEIARTLPRKMLLFALVILAACALYILVAPYLFAFLFPKYMPSLIFSQVVVLYTLSAVTYPFSSYLNAHKKLKDNYIMAITSFIVKIACLVVFVPLYGIWGAVIGLLATSAVTIVIASWLLYKARNESEPVEVREEAFAND